MQTASFTEPNHPGIAAALAPLVAPLAPRALALFDRNPVSATYGCGDRSFWYYRTLTNFGGATWQQPMVAFAALFRTEDAANPWRVDPEILEAAASALAYWARIGHADGAYDEWYLNEHSYCPTAITGAGAALTVHLLGDSLDQRRRDAALQALRRAGTWLDGRFNPTVMNQNLAAAVALAGLAKFDGGHWASAVQRKLDRIREEQSAEGWLPEYAGADFGYSTLALDLLAVLDRFTGGTATEEMARKLCEFLVAAQGGWSCLAGRLGSRGTSHAFPFGALYFAQRDPNAARLARDWIAGFRGALPSRPSDVDDRYFNYFYFPQFALAYHEAAETQRLATPAATQAGTIDLKESGFVAMRRDGWSALVSRRLGGAVAIASADEGLVTYHCGYEIALASGKRFSSAAWAKEGAVPPVGAEGEINVSAPFRPASAGLPLRRFMAPFQLAVGFLATSTLAEAFQGFVKGRMIAPEGGCALSLERHVAFDARGVNIRDTLSPGKGLEKITAFDVARSISMHSPSARQDNAHIAEIGDAGLVTVRDALNSGRAATIEFRMEGESGAVRVERLA